MKNKLPKIIWRYHYLQACKEVSVNDEIDLTPDKQGRWQIRGFINVNTNAMPEYKWAGKKIHVPVAWINQKGCKGANVPSLTNNFCCNFTYVFDANIGYSDFNVFGNTPNEVMEKVQKAFEKTFIVFNAIV